MKKMIVQQERPSPAVSEEAPAAASVDDLAELLRILGEPNRLRIVSLLRRGEACVLDLELALALPQNLLSHHLGVLRRAGVVLARRDDDDARWVFYRLAPERLRQLRDSIGLIVSWAPEPA